ncbi:MAG: sarcosine oxidase subunit alpha family protein [Alphaproteobacteria bacterium]
MQPNRISASSQRALKIDLDKPLSFRFDGKPYTGYDGDSLASALLANGVRLMGRSFKYHRPRGVIACGVEEPNALIQLETGAQTQPDLPATMIPLYDGLEASSQNRWPSLSVDTGAINSLLGRFFPAGFYYKTFMWPASLWTGFYEKIIRRAAGLGIAPDAPDPASYRQHYHHCDLLVAGGGLAGIYSALMAAKLGLKVTLANEHREWGGHGLYDPNLGEIDGVNYLEKMEAWLDALRAMPNVTLLSHTTIAGIYDDNYVIGLQHHQDHLHPTRQDQSKPRQILWKIRATQIFIAAGAFDRPILFANNDRPGVMLSNAISGYISRYAVLPGKDITIFTNNDSAYRSAFIAADHADAKIRIIDSRASIDSDLIAQSKAKNIALELAHAVCNTKGRLGINMIQIAPFIAGQLHLDQARWVSCDCLGTSGGLNPIVHLYSQAKGKLDWDQSRALFMPRNHIENVRGMGVHVVGAAAGHFEFHAILDHIHQKIASIAGITSKKAAKLPNAPTATGGDRLNLIPLWQVPHALGKKAFHDFQNDSTTADIALAAREGFLSVEHLKRYTTTGMATDQGKTSNINALAIMADIRGLSVPEVGTTTFRPPYSPISFGAITGQNRRELFHPARITPFHQEHLKDGAPFEDVGDWKRPHYFPQSGEDMHKAVARECLQTRKTVGMVDASTLGKIDIQGRDAAWFLNMIYTNKWDNLAIGKSRYGLMCNEHGMVFDDGVTTRIGENHFHMTTTTGGAARVMNWLEEWQQTEWPDRQVYFTSVTEQWAVASINGPMARAMLQPLTDIDLDQESFPFMSLRTGRVAGIPARVFRISFTGDLGFEVNVPARYGLSLWQALKQAGKPYDLCIYGTESLHVLRAEKGFIIVGQDTDGTVTPQDLGMNWIVSKKKTDFLGSRSHYRSDTARQGRKQLVGLYTDDPNMVLKEGAHIVETHLKKPPMHALGHVTSSYYSPNVGRSIALALVKDGLNRIGDKLCLPDMVTNKPVYATVTKPIFFDEKGTRNDG